MTPPKTRNRVNPLWRLCGVVGVSAILSLVLWGGSARAGTIFTGYIEVFNAATSADLGAISDQFVSSTIKRYGPLTNTPANRLQITFHDTGSVFAISTLNGPDSTLPFLGAVVGPASSSNDLGAGSFNYDLLTASVQTAPGTPPTAGTNAYSSQLIESSIWSLTGGNFLAAQWVNTNSSLPATYLYYLPGSNGLLLTGDPAAFNSAFPGGFQANFDLVGTFVSDVPEPSTGVLLLVGGVGALLPGMIRRKRAA
jgi:hypothetical protein